jgi:hypothetical protein
MSFSFKGLELFGCNRISIASFMNLSTYPTRDFIAFLCP